MAHKITIEDFNGYIVNSLLASSAGRNEHKDLNLVYDLANPIVKFKVINRKESEEFEFENLEEAIEKYNEI